MSTQNRLLPGCARPDGAGSGERPASRHAPAADPADLLALVVAAKKPVLLRVHSRRLRPDDLEECFAQAVLELLAGVRRGRVFASRRHVENALEQRFLSRVHDRRRALSGRSAAQAGLERALAPASAEDDRAAHELADPRADVHRTVLARLLLRRLPSLSQQLSADQRLVLGSQLGLAWECGEDFCARYGWSAEKYRKVAQRARTRLRALVEA
ncbi:MAG: hypothetical protein ACYCSI_06685 [Solirubrobacteraceae bacterium]